MPLLCLVPHLRLRPWSLPLHHGHLQHRRGQPAKQQRPQLQNPCRTHRRPLLRRILWSNFHDLLRCQAGGKHQPGKSNTGQRAEGKDLFLNSPTLNTFLAASEAVWQGPHSH